MEIQIFNVEVYLGSGQTSVMELFCDDNEENSEMFKKLVKLLTIFSKSSINTRLLTYLNSFLPNVPFSQKTSENLWFSDVFKGIKKKHWK